MSDPVSKAQSQEQPAPATVWSRVGQLARGLVLAVLRAVANAARTRTLFGLRDHVIVRQARKQIIAPFNEIVLFSRTAYRQAQDRLAQPAQTTLLEDASEVDIAHWLRNAQWSWVIAAAQMLVSAAVFSWGTSKTGFIAASTLIGGLAAMVYAAALMTRSSRDCWMMRTRRPLQLNEYLKRIDQLWMPLDEGHPLHSFSKVAFIPALICVLVGVAILTRV